MSVYVRRPSGLLAPFDVPELTVEAAIGRQWEKRGRLLLPKQPEYLFTFPYEPLPGPWGFAQIRFPWGDGVPWDGPEIGAGFLKGLPIL